MQTTDGVLTSTNSPGATLIPPAFGVIQSVSFGGPVRASRSDQVRKRQIAGEGLENGPKVASGKWGHSTRMYNLAD